MKIEEIIFEGETVKYCVKNGMTQFRVNTLFTKEPITIEWIKNVNPGEVVFDVGANVGMYTMLLASKKAKVYAFEPEALNYSFLCRNIKENNYTNAIAYCVGVLDNFEFSTLNSAHETLQTGGSCYMVGEDLSFNLEPAHIYHRQGIAVITLDMFCEKMKISPDHVKIDVDGLDYKVVGGNLKTLNKAKTILVELNPSWEQHQQAIDNMKSLGFKLDSEQVQASTRKNTQFEGLAEHLFYK